MLQDNLFVVSTSHLTDETMLYLASTDCLQWPFVGGPFQEKGWFFHVDDDVLPEPEEPFADLYGAMNYAAVRGYSHILFYDIGDVCEELSVFREPEFEEVEAVFYPGPNGHGLQSHNSFKWLARHIGSSAELSGVGPETIRLLATSLATLLGELAANIEEEAVPHEAQNRADLLGEIQAHLLAVKLLFQAFKTGAVPGLEVI